ncbi:DUF1641 domain-containing protein [Granulicella paludicola]|uniref:DUF1641 domain-containing protein n=1 Tax=Granulicella paludicola TaxID=474951 RepID=UPI0021DFCC81|nr:DUF1641 domain-containing protein [Granulicella paludicola]
MAHPISFVPQKHDPQKELMARVEAAPAAHAEALLMAWEVLQTAHDKGMLDLAKGLIGGKDVITGKLAEAANTPEVVAGIRNGMAGARLLASVDPAMLQRLAQALEGVNREHAEEKEPPSLWRLFRRSTSRDARRGLSYMTRVLEALGKATESSEK